MSCKTQQKKINKCAYCGNTEKLTREHTISKTLADKYFDGTKSAGYFNDKERYTNDLQTIKDVCPNCNNGKLSELDNYFLTFLESNSFLVSVSIHDKESVNINYEYEKLSKYILKMLYNSERKNSYAGITSHLEKCKKYIIDKHEGSPFFAIYMKILKDLTPDDIAKHNQNINKLKPYLKVGNMLYTIGNKIDNVKIFIFSNLACYVFTETTEHMLKHKIEEFLSSMPDRENYHNLQNQQSEFKISNDSIIDYLRNTFQGNKMFIERESEIRKLTTKLAT